MKILICVPTTSMVHSEFMQSMLRLKRPAGCVWSFATDSLIYHARNWFAEQAIKENYDYVFFIDSDMVLPEDTLLKLLEHKKDIVSGFCFKRVFPFSPVAWTKLNEDESVSMKEWEDGLINVEATGMACTLIKTEVFKSIGHDWFLPGKYSEDLMFCLRAKRAGYEIYVDTNLIITHIGKMMVTEKQYVALMEYENSANARE